MNILSDNTFNIWPIWLKWCPSSEYHAILAETKMLNSVQCVKELFTVDIFNRKYKIRTLYTYRNNFKDENERIKYFNRTPIVLLHGMGAGLAMWCKNLDELTYYRQVYAFDLIGFGNSSRANFPSELKETELFFIKSIEEWRLVLNLDKFILIGHSLGGYLASCFAIKHSEIVTHLILVDPWGMRECKSKRRHKIQFNIRSILLLFGYFFKYLNPLFPLRLLGPIAPSILRIVRQDLGRTFTPVHLPLTMANFPEIAQVRHLVHDNNHVTHTTINPKVKEPMPYNSDINAIFDYIYHCNVKSPSGEAAFRSLSDPIGWAAKPMMSRMHQLDSSIPVTFIYGGKSWMDWHTGYQIQQLRSDSIVNVRVIDNAGHHVYAEASDEFNNYTNNIILLIEQEIDKIPETISSTNSRNSSDYEDSSDEFAM